MSRPPNFNFYGDPNAIAAAAQSAQGWMAADAQRRVANTNARAGLQQTLLEQPAVFTGQAVDLTNAYGQNLAGMLGAYGGTVGQYFQGLEGLGGSAANMYGNAATALGGVGQASAGALGQIGSAGASALGQIGASGANAAGQLGTANQSALGGLYASSNNALAGAHQATMAGQATRDAANAQAAGQIGAASQGAQSQVGQSAMNNLGAIGASELAANANIMQSGNQARGQLGAARQASLANQAIAAANAYGQMATGMYNMQGQLGNSLAAVAAAENAALGNAAAAQQAAGPQYAKLNYLAAALPEILNTTQYGMQSAPYAASGLGGLALPGGGEVGFSAYGPEGLIASGGGMAPSWGGGGGGGFVPPPGPPGASPIDFEYAAPELPDFSQARLGATSFLDSLMRNANSEGATLRADLARQLDANRDASMDSRELDAIDTTPVSGAEYADRIGGLVPTLLESLTSSAAGSIGGLGGGGYSSSGAFNEIRGNTQEGRNALQSGFADGMSGLSGLLEQASGDVAGSTAATGGQIGGMVRNTAGAMRPFLDQGQMALDRLAGQMGGGMQDFTDAYGTATSGLGDSFDRTSGDIFGTYGDTIGPLFGGVFGIGKPREPQTNAERIAQLQEMIPGLSGSTRRFYEKELARRQKAA